MTSELRNHWSLDVGSLLSQANQACDVTDLVRAVEEIAYRPADQLVAPKIIESAFEVLENESLVGRCVADHQLWVLSALATLEPREDPLWRATVRMVALQVEGLGESGIEVASLFRVAGVAEKAAQHLIKGFPVDLSLAHLWGALAARWVTTDDSVGDALTLAVRGSTSQFEMTSAILEGGQLTDHWLERFFELEAKWPCVRDLSKTMDELGFSNLAIRRQQRASYRSRMVRSPSLIVRADGRWVRIFDRSGSTLIRWDGVCARVFSNEPVAPSSIADRIGTVGIGSVVEALHSSLGGGPLERERRAIEPSLAADYVWTRVRTDVRRELALTATLLGIPDACVDACLAIIEALGDVRVGFIIADQVLVPNLVIESGEPVATSTLRSLPWISGTHQRMLETSETVAVRCFLGAQVAISLEVPLMPGTTALGRVPMATRSAADELGSDCISLIATMTSSQRSALFSQLVGIELIPAPNSELRRVHCESIVRTSMAAEPAEMPKTVSSTLLCLIERLGLREALRVGS